MDKPVTQEEIIKFLTRGVRSRIEGDLRFALADRIKAEGIAPPEGFILVGRDDAESYMQMLYMASNGKSNAYAACANEIKAMLAIAPKPEDV